MLIQAVLALFVLPVLVLVFRRARPLQDVVDGVVLTTVAGVVLLEVLPNVLAQSAVWGFIAFVAGFLIPTLGEKALSKKGGGGLFLVVLLFSAHSILDGVALQGAQSDSMEAAVVLHRLPAGLLIFSHASPDLAQPTVLPPWVSSV